MIVFKTVVFFFSSRRRHTRWTGDWSSDVCSSDLGEREAVLAVEDPAEAFAEQDVAGPAGPGEGGEAKPGRVQSTAVAAAGEQHDPGACQDHPERVQPAARPGDRDQQRSGELDGDRDAQWNPV